MTFEGLANSWVRDISAGHQTPQGVLTAHPKIVAFATQGTDTADADRLRTLLSKLPYTMFPFDRDRKRNSFIALLKHIFHERPELVIMEGTGLAGGLALIIGRLFRRTRYVVSSGDAIGPFVRKSHPVLGLAFSLYETLLYKCCTGFIGWTPYLVGRALTLGAPKAITAAGWAQFEKSVEELELTRKRVRREMGIPDNHIVIGIVSSLGWNKRVGYCYGYELVRAVNATERGDIHVLIVGDGDGRRILEKLSGEELGRRIHFTGRVPREQVPDYLAAMDAASLPQSIDKVGSFRYTTKISEYMATGLLVVTGHLPLAYDLPSEYFLRLPGAAPWHPDYIYAMAQWMNGLTDAELQRKHTSAGWLQKTFNKQLQIDGVTGFIADILHDSRVNDPEFDKKRYIAVN